MQRKNPTAVRFTAEQLDRIRTESATTGIPKNRIVRLAIDAYFSDRSAA
ncbi:MAG: ribbon-helix-helix domain-containing protein [Cyanobacteria bacterium]|nr:ribbon-helix-helix domain-containing protein [Cyanobacteriota bacterium]